MAEHLYGLANTEHLPGISSYMSAQDVADEQFRANLGTTRRRRLDPVPEEWQHAFTEEAWAAYKTERFRCYHSYACLLSPEAYLDGTREDDMLGK